MKVYLDSEYKCHLVNDGTMLEFEAPFFDGKCQTLVEGYRYVPAGHSWTRNDGVVFHGEMVAPWKNFNELAQAQALYDMINEPNEIAPTRIDEMEAQLAYISMMTDLM